MGLYDRDYSRENEPGIHLGGPQSITTQIVIFTAVVYVAQLASSTVTDVFSLHALWYHRPWQLYELLTYGFLHDPDDAGHILINMLVLWMFGREIEMRYGRREFLTFYLAAIVFAGLIWSISEAGFGAAPVLVQTPLGAVAVDPARLAAMKVLLGASGGIGAVFVLYALNFPHRQVLFMFFIPMPMWVAALIAISFDIYGTMDRSGKIACVAHLAGALFGFCYYKFGWSLSGMFAGLDALKPRPKTHLRVHEPDEEDDLSQKVDEILKKIAEQGQDSLSWSERRTLEKASRRYQEKRK